MASDQFLVCKFQLLVSKCVLNACLNGAGGYRVGWLSKRAPQRYSTSTGGVAGPRARAANKFDAAITDVVITDVVITDIVITDVVITDITHGCMPANKFRSHACLHGV